MTQYGRGDTTEIWVPAGLNNRSTPVVLGLHKDPWNNTGVAFVAGDSNGGRVIAHANLERFNREKSSRAFPANSVAACVAEVGLNSPQATDFVLVHWSMSDAGWEQDFRRNPCRTDVLLAQLAPDRIVRVKHHQCHAAATFFTSPFEKAAVLVVDDRCPNYEIQTLWLGEGNQPELVAETADVGICLMYEAITRWIGFGPFEAGKTMSMAPFGRTQAPLAVSLVGNFNSIFTDYGHLYGTNDEILLEDPKPPSFNERARYVQTVQKECERAMLHLAKWAKDYTGLDSLCLGGGIDLNGVANYKIRRPHLSTSLFVNFDCSESGVALATALWDLHGVLDMHRSLEFVPPYTRSRYSLDESRVP